MLKKGVLYILMSSAFFAVMNLMAKDLSELHPMQVVFFRAIGTFIFIFPYMLAKGISIKGNNPKFLTLRAIVGLLSLSTFFAAIQRIPLGPAISIRYLGPIFGAYFAYLFLKEKVNMKQWLCFALAFAGVLVIKGFDIRIDNLSLILVLISALFVGLVFVLLRYLSPKEHFLTIINYFMVACILSSLFFIPSWTWPSADLYVSIIGIGITGLLGQVFMTIAFKKAETNVLAPFKYSELIFALLLTFFFLGEVHPWQSFTGMAMIVVGMLLNVYFKNNTKLI